MVFDFHFLHLNSSNAWFSFVCVRITLLNCKLLCSDEIRQLVHYSFPWCSCGCLINQVTSSTLCSYEFLVLRMEGKEKKKILMVLLLISKLCIPCGCQIFNFHYFFFGIYIFPLTFLHYVGCTLNPALINCFICRVYFQLDPDCMYIFLFLSDS